MSADLEFGGMPPNRVHVLFVESRCTGSKAVESVSLMRFGWIGTRPFDFSVLCIDAQNLSGLAFVRR